VAQDIPAGVGSETGGQWESGYACITCSWPACNRPSKSVGAESAWTPPASLRQRGRCHRAEPDGQKQIRHEALPSGGPERVAARQQDHRREHCRL